MSGVRGMPGVSSTRGGPICQIPGVTNIGQSDDNSATSTRKCDQSEVKYTESIDADHNTTMSVYDGGQMTEQYVVGSGSTEFWHYDLAGNQNSLIDADNNT